MAPIPSTGDLVEVYRLPDYDLVATPVTPHGIVVRPEKNGPGQGYFSIAMADDPAYGEIQIDDVAAIRRNGQTVAAMVVEMIAERTLDEQGAYRQIATYSGRLVGCFMEWALIFPANGAGAKPVEDDCILDWRSPRYNPTTYGDPWTDSTELCSVDDAKGGVWPTQPMGQSFTDGTGAQMIWASGGTTEFADPGTCLFAFEVNITSPGRHGLEVLMDNEGVVWCDAIEMLNISGTEGYHRASFKRIDLTEGIHRFCFRVRNLGPVETAGPGALAFNLFKTDHQDRPLPDTPPVAVSDSNVQILEYSDDEPGMTVGDDLTQFLDEADDRNKLTWLVPTFTFDEDSNGDPFPRESITTKTGTTSLLQFLDELVAAGRIARWRLRPDGVSLDVFAPGYSTRPTSVDYPDGFELEPTVGADPRTGQLLELNRRIT